MIPGIMSSKLIFKGNKKNKVIKPKEATIVMVIISLLCLKNQFKRTLFNFSSSVSLVTSKLKLYTASVAKTKGLKRPHLVLSPIKKKKLSLAQPHTMPKKCCYIKEN